MNFSDVKIAFENLKETAVITVDELIQQLKDISESGYGDKTISVFKFSESDSDGEFYPYPEIALRFYQNDLYLSFKGDIKY